MQCLTGRKKAPPTQREIQCLYFLPPTSQISLTPWQMPNSILSEQEALLTKRDSVQQTDGWFKGQTAMSGDEPGKSLPPPPQKKFKHCCTDLLTLTKQFECFQNKVVSWKNSRKIKHTKNNCNKTPLKTKSVFKKQKTQNTIISQTALIRS